MNILFLCKYNRFRSRVAEAYFKKINNDMNIIAESAGLIEGFLPLDKNEVETTEREAGISILGKPRTISMDLLDKQDIIVVVADDFPKDVLNHHWYKDKVIYWDIRDNKHSSDNEEIKIIIREIIKRVEELNDRFRDDNQKS